MKILLPVSLLFFSWYSFGATESRMVEEMPFRDRIQTLKVGPLFHSFDYAEEHEAPLKSTESGTLPGLKMSWENHGIENPLWMGLDLSGSMGSTDFDGTYQNGTPVQTKTDHKWYEAEFRGGVRLNSLSRWGTIHGYAGLGYHSWSRDIRGFGGYGERYSWFYIPFGARYHVDLSSRFDVMLDATVKIPFGGNINVYLSDLSPAFQDASGSLGSRVGYKVALPFTYNPSYRFGIQVVPWIEYVGIGEGDAFTVFASNGQPVMVGREPASSNTLIGTQLNLVFSM